MWIFPLLLVQLFYFEGFRSFCHEYYVGLVPTMNGRIQDNALIAKSQVHSIERCTEICSRDTSCVTFFYNSKTGQCQTHSIWLQPNSTDQIDSDWGYYQIYAEGCDPQDGLIFDRKQNLCYFISSDKKSWDDANQECIQRGLRFLQIKTKEFQHILGKTLAYSIEYSSYVGCYKDSSFRIFPHYTGSFSYMTIDVCRNRCYRDGYKYAGLQRKNACYCGDGDYDKYGESTDCVDSCAGNENEICGGNWASSVYKIGDFCYIGLRNENGTNKWSDGQLLTGFSDWMTTNPLDLKYSCIYLDPLRDYKWNKRPCKDKVYFMCEKVLKRA